MLTLAAVAERRDAQLIDATTTATGHMSRRDDGRFGFTVIEIDAELETVPGGEEAVRAAVKATEQRCLISQALNVPVHVGAIVKPLATNADAAGGIRRCTQRSGWLSAGSSDVQVPARTALPTEHFVRAAWEGPMRRRAGNPQRRSFHAPMA